MLTVLAVVLVIELFSVALLFINIRLFRGQAEKYRVLLQNLGYEGGRRKEGRILVPLYVVCTLSATVVTIAIIVFQPHLL